MAMRFDASLPTFVKILVRHFDHGQLSRAAVIRDATGRLSVVLPEPANVVTMELAAAEVSQRLGAYARPDVVIRDIGAIGTQRLLEEAAQVAPLDVEGIAVRLLD